MAASAYLASCHEARLPGAAEWAAWRARQTRDFQAEHTIPLFWLAMYYIDDVRVNGVDKGGLPFLLTPVQRASDRLTRRRRGVLLNVGLRYAELYDEFRRIVRDELGPYVLVHAPAPLGRHDELIEALDALTMLDLATEFPKNPALRKLMGYAALTQALGTARAPYMMAGHDVRRRWPRSDGVYEETQLDSGRDRLADAARWRMWKTRGHG